MVVEQTSHFILVTSSNTHLFELSIKKIHCRCTSNQRSSKLMGKLPVAFKCETFRNKMEVESFFDSCAGYATEQSKHVEIQERSLCGSPVGQTLRWAMERHNTVTLLANRMQTGKPQGKNSASFAKKSSKLAFISTCGFLQLRRN